MRCTAINTIHYTVPGEKGIKIALPGESFDLDEESFEELEKSKAAIREFDNPIVYPDTATMLAAGYRDDGFLKNASDYGTPASVEAIAAAAVADKAKAEKVAAQLAADEVAAADAAAKLITDQAAADKAAADKAAADKAAADKAAADKAGGGKKQAPDAPTEDHIG
jgi:hypothetical protein